MTLSTGFYDVANTHVATIVTHLEMTQKPAPRAEHSSDLTLQKINAPNPDWYRALFRKVGGEDWLWFSRLAMEKSELNQILSAPDIQIYAVQKAGQDLGLLELDFSKQDECELAFFGLAPDVLGTGAGRWLMNRALELVWSRPITRFHVHTCTLDHPAALDFYRRSGFTAIKRQVEIAPDPRLNGILSEQAAKHIPILR